MNTYFREYRNVSLSYVEYIETQVNANWNNVSVVKSYPNIAKTALPVIAVRVPLVSTEFLEIGSRQTRVLYTCYIDIFAKSDPQREDLTQFIIDTCLVDCNYYTYAKDPSNAEQLVKTLAGKINFRQFTENSNLQFGEDADISDRYRQFISLDLSVAKS